MYCSNCQKWVQINTYRINADEKGVHYSITCGRCGELLNKI